MEPTEFQTDSLKNYIKGMYELEPTPNQAQWLKGWISGVTHPTTHPEWAPLYPILYSYLLKVRDDLENGVDTIDVQKRR